MSHEWYKKIINKHPILFFGHPKKRGERPICGSFECGPGWANLLNALADALEPLCIKLREPNRPNSVCIVTQVKEKFGTLRFYLGSSTPEMDKLIRRAEKASAKICEACGKPGRMYTEGWFKVRCTNCYNKK